MPPRLITRCVEADLFTQTRSDGGSTESDVTAVALMPKRDPPWVQVMMLTVYENSERIFELFRRLHTDEEYNGVGIGLTLCKRIVECQGGNIGVTPAYSGGSIFWFTIPKPQVEVMLG